MQAKSVRRTLLATFGCWVVSTVHAQGVPPSLDACWSNPDGAKRLACYDREIVRLHQLAAGSPAAPPGSAAPAAPPPGSPPPGAAPPPGSPPLTALPPAASPPGAGTAPVPAKPAYAGPPDPHDPNAIDRFGLTPEMQHARQEEGRAPKELSQVNALVTSVKYKPRGEIIIRLDNGQTWEQAEYDGDVSMSVGDPVTIKAGALHAYYLKPRLGRIVRVRRVS